MKLNLRTLDALRGILATYVVAGHARWLLWEGWETWQKHTHPFWATVIIGAGGVLRYGHQAVIVFFALSGFFIHLPAAEKLSRGEPFTLERKRFFQRRSWRLVPPYACALVLTLICDQIGRYIYPALYLGNTGDPTLDSNFAPSGYSLQAIIPALVLLPRSFNVTFGSNGPLWSLAYEVIYYLLYPLWLILRARGYGFGLLPVFGGLLLACFPFCSNFATSVLSHYPAWLAGAMVAEYCTNAKKSPLPLWIICLVALSLLIPKLPFSGQMFVNTIGGSACVLLFTQLPPWATRVAGGFLLVSLGLRSYSIYIFHFPILALCSAITFAECNNRPSNLFIAAAGTLLAVAICWICFEYVEKPFLSIRRQEGTTEAAQ